jgi:hypothetical protein
MGDGFVASMSIEGVLSGRDDPETALKAAASIYGTYISRMRFVMREIGEFRTSRTLLPARKVWQIGDSIFGLVRSLGEAALEIEDLYAHLVRDVGAKRKWLEKAIILRRYVPREDMIPADLNWGRIEKGTRRAAEKIFSDALSLGN